MSRITEDIVQRLDIVDIVSRYVPLKRTGTNFSGNCPFHQEKTPSFVVSSHKQIFKCFGCGKGGNVITFIMEIERMDFWDAIKILAKDANVDLQEYEVNMEKLQEIGEGKEKIKRMHNIAQHFFLSQLQNTHVAKTYLYTNRHLTDTYIEQFGIGYADDNHYSLVQHLKSKGFTDADIIEASLGKKGNSGEVYDFFRNRITFPIFDAMKNVVAFGARALTSQDMPKYLNSSNHHAYDKSKILYGIDQLKLHVKEHNFAIIVEGYMDVIGAARLGYPVAVATCGTSLTNDHLKLLKRYTPHIYMLFDNDKAGLQATIRGLQTAYEHDIFPQHIQLPDKIKDLDELANQENGQELFDNARTNAIDGFLYVLEHVRTQNDISSPIHKQHLLDTMFACIMAIHNTALQAHYLQILADNIGIAYEVILPQYKHYTKTQGKNRLLDARNALHKITTIHQPSKEYVFFSLVYEDFLVHIAHTCIATHTQEAITVQAREIREPLLHFIQYFYTAITDSQLHSPLTQLTDQNLQEIHETHIRRERELERYTDDEQKKRAICKAIGPFIHDTLPLILKHGDIPDTTKQKLLTDRKYLWG